MTVGRRGAGLWKLWVAVAGVLACWTASFGADVTLQFTFPQDRIAEESTDGTQQQTLETTFGILVVPPTKPEIAQEPETRLEEVEVEGRVEKRRVIVRRPFEISSAVEGGRISLLDEDGTQIAFKALAEYTWDSGFSVYANGGFEYFTLDDVDGDGKGSLLNLGARQQFWDGMVKLGGLVTWRYTDVKIIDVSQDVHSLGGGLMAAFEKDLGPVTLSGGLIYQFLRDMGDLERSNHLLSYGVGVGVPIGRQFVANLETFQVNDLDRDADPVIIGASFSFFITRRWGLTLGWKTILNVDDYSSHEGTLGASARF